MLARKGRDGAGRIRSNRPLPSTGRSVVLAATAAPERIRLSFEHCDHGGDFCLSRCDQRQVRQAVDCLRKLTSHTWVSAFSTGGRGVNSGGLGYEQHDRHRLTRPVPDEVPGDALIFSVRASLQFRIYGYRAQGVGFILWFDPNHEIIPD